MSSLPVPVSPFDEDSRVGGSHLFHLGENRFQSGAITYDSPRMFVWRGPRQGSRLLRPSREMEESTEHRCPGMQLSMCSSVCPPLATILTCQTHETLFPEKVVAPEDSLTLYSRNGGNSFWLASHVGEGGSALTNSVHRENFLALELWHPPRLPVDRRMNHCLACGSSVIWSPLEELLLRVPHPSDAMNP